MCHFMLREDYVNFCVEKSIASDLYRVCRRKARIHRERENRLADEEKEDGSTYRTHQLSEVKRTERRQSSYLSGYMQTG